MIRINLIGLAAVALTLGACSTSLKNGFPVQADAYLAENTSDPLDVFAPGESEGSGRRIDYGAYNQLLGTIVFDVGPSERKAPPKPLPMSGSRIQRENTSRYRLEGNRIAFSIQPEALENVTQQIVESFTRIAEAESFDQNSPDEKLAFWLNFHNALLINQMAGQYPFTRLASLNAIGSDTNVYDAKIVAVRGVPLSLNDIRHGIVYRYWDDPMTIYGFFLGTVGGPNIRTSAYSGFSVNRQLAQNGREFVNSLRGVEIIESSTRVSLVFKDALPLFDGSKAALLEHIESLANSDTKKDIFSGAGLRMDVYDWTVADLSYGEMPPPIGNFRKLDGNGLSGVFDRIGISPQAEEFIRRIEAKKLRMFRRRGGDVSIVDVTPPESEQPSDENVEAEEKE